MKKQANAIGSKHWKRAAAELADRVAAALAIKAVDFAYWIVAKLIKTPARFKLVSWRLTGRYGGFMRRIVYLMIILGWGGTPAAFAQHSAPLPDKLGYHSVNVSGEEKVQIMVSKILDGLEKGDPYIFTGLLAETYQEIPAAKDDLTGYYLTKSNHRQGVVSMLNSRAAFIDKVTRQQYDENELLYYSDRDYLLQGDAVDCSIEARTADGEMRGAIRLFFSKTAHGWQLTMSDGLSILAGWKMKLPTPKSASSEHLLYRVEDIGNTDGRTFSQARLAPEHGIKI